MRSCAAAPAPRQRLARHAGAAAGAQQPQDLALALGQADDLRAVAQFAALQREGERAEARHAAVALRRRRAGAPQHRADAQQQLARFERLGEIIVDADLQPAHAIGRLGARGQHDDRHVGALAQAFGEGEAVFARHHHVEDDEVEGEVGEKAARLGGRGGDGDAMAVLRKIGRQQVAQAAVVVDHQHMGGVVGERRGGGAHFAVPRPEAISAMTRSRSGASIIA